MLVHADPDDLASLRLVVLAGRRWPADLHDRHRQALPDTVLTTEHGVPEVSVWSTGFVCPDEPLAGPPPVGTPIPGATVHVLDHRLSPVLPGETGEVYLGGPGVARGYHDNPAATGERFVPDPFAAEPGARMYRTGAIAWHAPTASTSSAGPTSSPCRPTA
jgi:non-ribosomal peptide synthetase component F